MQAELYSLFLHTMDKKGSVYLCGHTGSYNRGSAAIVITTAQIAKQLWPDKEIVLASFDLASDKALGVTSHFDRTIAYCRDQFVYKALGCFFRKIVHHDLWAFRIIQWNLLQQLTPNDIVLNVGGDIYCYPGAARTSYALIDHTYRHNIPSIFWGCSLEEKLIDAKMLHNLQQYTLIVARESITYQLLLKKGIAPDRLLLLPDPAFTLPKKPIALPEHFEHCIGINMSPLVLSSSKHAAQLLDALHELMRYILAETHYNIALIPHVYTPQRGEDAQVNDQLKQQFPSERVFLFDDNYQAEELKYILSQCDTLVCARTHASIAAYSSHVPTLVIGYSTKSKGIAQDLFGAQNGYVIEAQDAYKENLIAHFQQLIQHLDVEKEKLILKTKEIEGNFKDKGKMYEIIPKLKALI